MNDGGTSWLGCRKCCRAVAVLPRDNRPCGDPQPDDDAVTEFLSAHSGHEVTHLYRTDGSALVATRPLWDPMALTAVEVTDGRAAFILTAERSSIDEPRAYRFAAGELVRRRSIVDVDTTDLRRGLDLEFYPHSLRPSLVNRFVEAVLDLVDSLAAEDLEIAFDDADDPSVSIARLPSRVYDALYTRCTEIFPTEDLAKVHKFLQDNRFEDGLLALRVRRELELETALLR